MSNHWYPEVQTEPPAKKHRVLFTHQCIYCSKYFNTFSYAARHMNDRHRRAMAARGMTYPRLLREDERFAVYLERMPKKQGYSKPL